MKIRQADFTTHRYDSDRPPPPRGPHVLLPLDPRKDTIYRCWTLCKYFTTCNIQVPCDIVTRNK